MRKKNRKAVYRKIILRLPDPDHSKTAVLNSLSSSHSRRQNLEEPVNDRFGLLFAARAVGLR
jgi:hypothetical protein